MSNKTCFIAFLALLMLLIMMEIRVPFYLLLFATHRFWHEDIPSLFNKKATKAEKKKTKKDEL